jgi:hypothetical protein
MRGSGRSAASVIPSNSESGQTAALFSSRITARRSPLLARTPLLLLKKIIEFVSLGGEAVGVATFVGGA